MKANKVYAIIPAYNEEANIIDIIKKTKKYLDKVVVVDDGSKDKTKELAEKADAIVLRHLVNLGKGAALKTGCDYAVKKNANFILLLMQMLSITLKTFQGLLKN